MRWVVMHDDCKFNFQTAVIQTTDEDKYSISVEWTAPAVLGTGQVVIQ